MHVSHFENYVIRPTGTPGVDKVPHCAAFRMVGSRLLNAGRRLTALLKLGAALKVLRGYVKSRHFRSGTARHIPLKSGSFVWSEERRGRQAFTTNPVRKGR